MAETLITILADYNLALVHSKEVLQMIKEDDDEWIKAKAYRTVGASHYYMGEYDKALELYNLSLEALDKINPETNQVKREKGRMFRRISIVFNQEEDNHKRLFYLERALEIFEELNDKTGLAQVYLSLGGYHYYKDDYLKSIAFQKKALVLRTETNDVSGQAYSYLNLGHCYSKLGKYELAEKFLNESLSINERIREPYTSVSINLYLGECFYCQKNGRNR